MRKPLFVLASTLAAAASPHAAAANDPWSAPFNLQIGAFQAEASTQARLDASSGAAGSSLSFEGDLAVEDSKTLPTLDFTWRLAKHHAFEGSIVSLHREGTRTLTGQVNWGDLTFPVSTAVNSKFDSDIFRFAYRYSFVNEPGGEFAVLLGVHYTNIESEIAGVAGNLSKSTAVEYPLPTIGVRGSARLGDNWRISGFGQILKLKIDEYDGEVINYGVGLEWAYARNMTAGIGYDYYKYNVVSTKERTRFEFDYRFDGPKLYFGFSF
jgi:opacity protein-like surface antigen